MMYISCDEGVLDDNDGPRAGCHSFLCDPDNAGVHEHRALSDDVFIEV
jgi:hypothetical protein